MSTLRLLTVSGSPSQRSIASKLPFTHYQRPGSRTNVVWAAAEVFSSHLKADFWVFAVLWCVHGRCARQWCCWVDPGIGSRVCCSQAKISTIITIACLIQKMENSKVNNRVTKSRGENDSGIPKNTNLERMKKFLLSAWAWKINKRKIRQCYLK